MIQNHCTEKEWCDIVKKHLESVISEECACTKFSEPASYAKEQTRCNHHAVPKRQLVQTYMSVYVSLMVATTIIR